MKDVRDRRDDEDDRENGPNGDERKGRARVHNSGLENGLQYFFSPHRFADGAT